MTDLKKRILETLGRLAFYAAPQLFGKPYTEQLSSTQLRKRAKHRKREKRSNGLEEVAAIQFAAKPSGHHKNDRILKGGATC